MNPTFIPNQQVEMTGITEPAGEKDKTFYWPDNVRFLVEGCLFRMPQYPFIAASEYFAQRHGLCHPDNPTNAVDAVQLEAVTAEEFRIFLRALFPSLSSDSATITFTKEEWLSILRLSTLWQFKDLRRLSIKHLDGQLDEIELVQNGRTAYVPRWVSNGYGCIIERPAQQIITPDEAEAIGSMTVNHLWIIRWMRANSATSTTVAEDIRSTFVDELSPLEEREREYRTKKEVEKEERALEEARVAAEEERALEEARVAAEEEERRRLAMRAATEALERAKQRKLEEARLAKETVLSTLVEEASTSPCEQPPQEITQEEGLVPISDNDKEPIRDEALGSTLIGEPPLQEESEEDSELQVQEPAPFCLSDGTGAWDSAVQVVVEATKDSLKKKKKRKITCQLCMTKFHKENGDKKTRICAACTALGQLESSSG